MILLVHLSKLVHTRTIQKEQNIPPAFRQYFRGNVSARCISPDCCDTRGNVAACNYRSLKCPLPKRMDLQGVLGISALTAAFAKKEESVIPSRYQVQAQNGVLRYLSLSIDGALWNTNKPHDHISSSSGY